MPPRKRTAAEYEKHKTDAAAVSRKKSEAGREIGPLPKVKNARRRNKCRLSLRLFCETYLAARFALAWSADQLKVIAKIEDAVLHGGLFALAMPRGSGKTSLVEAAAAWAILYGHRRFVAIIGATDGAAVEILDSIKMMIETNDMIADDFPAACYPVRRLEGINNRAAGQTLDGERTRITWTEDEVVFPTVKKAPSSGAIIRVAGITGRVRGMKAATADGKTVRPDFAIADDPQTDESADSLISIGKRERVLRGAVKGLAGPGKTISMVVPCTVISPGDLSERILDRDRNPQFQGERMRMVYQFPKNQELWDRYAELRRESFRNDRKGEEATEFYRQNRAAMDEGAVVAWPERFDPAAEASAVQAAMNLLIDNPREFRAEYQNDPDKDVASGAKELVPAAVADRLSGLPRYEVPRECSRLTAFIDVGGELHWYAVVAWDGGCGGSVVDYGTWPRQTRSMFAADDPRPSLSLAYPNHSETQRVYAGLADLTNEVLGRGYPREGGADELRVERCLIDCGWSAQTVHQFCRATPHAGVIYPSKGAGRTTTARGVSEWKPRPGERTGYHWRLTVSDTGRGRMAQFDPDMWKTFLFERLTTSPGGRGHLSLFGERKGGGPASGLHEMIGQHCGAEYAEPVTVRGVTFNKWVVRPHKPDNHLFDCLVGAAVAASVAGLTWSAAPGGVATAGTATPQKKPKMTLGEIMAAKEKRAEQLSGNPHPNLMGVG